MHAGDYSLRHVLRSADARRDAHLVAQRLYELAAAAGSEPAPVVPSEAASPQAEQAPLWPSVEPITPPIFILGHWRSGTTHLYNIMSRAEHFHTVSPFATALPWDFLSLTRLFGPALAKALPEGRYIDNIPVAPDSPQ
ncbi:MAG: sulfotransferase, partial [Chloroflexi bacterium]|nr:sulfotransferase [Chloroflexota bacterium]